jgi:GT2 family glycosyltransferase
MKVFVVIPNWNGADMISECLTSLEKQSLRHSVVLVDNGSIDDSVEIVAKKHSSVKIIKLPENTGFTGGVNTGIEYALKHGAEAVALLNNDAVAESKWLENLTKTLKKSKTCGIVTSKFLSFDGKKIDSTGDIYTSWGLPYPRGRDELDSLKFGETEEIFGASGGASLYRAEMLKEIGLFDQKYFAYLEDVDLSWRAQLAGWKVLYEPKAIAYHKIGATSGRIKGFSTYHYMKNLPMLFWKNVPTKFIPVIFPRLLFAYWTIVVKQLLTGNRWATIKGQAAWLKNIPHTFRERSGIQKSKKVSDEYIWSILTHDLPPNAANLRRLRGFLKL